MSEYAYEIKYYTQGAPFFSRIDAWANEFRLSDYMNWFDTININTLIWQGIVIFLLVWFRKELTEIVHALIKKIPEIKSFGRTEFELSAKTKKDVDENSRKLDKELANQKKAMSEDPNFVFLSIFLETEVLLFRLHSLVFRSLSESVRVPSRVAFRSLVRGQFIGENFLHDFYSYNALRNQIVHEKQTSFTPDEIINRSKALLLLKSEIAKAIEKHRPRQLGERLPSN